MTCHPAFRAMASAFSMSFFGCLRSLIMLHDVASCQRRINGIARRRQEGGRMPGTSGSAAEGRPGEGAQVRAVPRIELAEVVAEFERCVDRRPQVIPG